VEAYAAFEPRLAAARQRLSPEHDDAKELALFGEWYAFRGVPEWGADLLERARKTGETVSSLMLACCYWRMNDLASARREFQRALDRKEAPASYLNLCLSAVTRGYAQYAASPSNALEEQRYQASSGDARSLNALAWLSATSPREDRRDGSIAVVLAERAAIATHRKDPAILDTLAAGLAEAGRFAEATRVQREAVKLLGDDKSKEDYGSRLKLYESNAPYRESAADDSAGAANDRLAMATLLRARGTLCAQFAQWTLATRELTKAITISPDEYWNWYQLAPLLLETGDVGGYRKHCHAMLVRFGATSAPPIAERTAKVCLMLPMPKEDLVLAAKLAETAVTVGKGQPWEPYFQFVKGLAEYRQGNFEKAAEWMQKTLTRDIPLAESKGQAYCVLAMAQHRLNRVAEAREALSKAANIAETKSPEIDSGDLGPNWHDWLIARALMREANILIEGGSKAGDQTK
jgi:tetratricopeptide (TPR) repeat protein